MTMTLESEYEDAITAEAVYRSIVPDDDGYVRTRLDGNRVIFVFRAKTAGQMRSAMNDVLACIKISEGTSGIVPATAPDLDGDPPLE